MDGVPSGSKTGVILEPSLAKRISPSIKWCFTLNNYTDDEIDKLVPLICKLCRFGIVGKEAGEEGTPHLQGYIEFKTKQRPLGVFRNKRIHWEKAKANRQANIDYCSKDGDLLLVYPEPEVVDTIEEEELFGWQRRILKDIEDKPDKRTINWYWSHGGMTGKTTFCKYLCVNKGFIMLGGKASDCKNGVLEYAKANFGKTPKKIVVNIPRSMDDKKVSYEAYESLKDMIFYSGKYEGGMVCGNCPHLYIFANFEPDESMLSADRWKIFCVD